MTYKVRLPRPISGVIGGCGLSRPAIIRLLNRLRERLELHADNFAHNRAHENPDCFVYSNVIVDKPTWYNCHFLVNDRREAGVLVIEGFSYVTRPATDESRVIPRGKLSRILTAPLFQL